MLLIHILTFVSLAVASPLAHHDLDRRAPVAQTPSTTPSMWDNFTQGMSNMWSKAEHSMSDMAPGFTTGLSTMASGMATMLGMGPMTHDHNDASSSQPMAAMTGTPVYDSPAPMYTMPSAPLPANQGSGAGSGVSDSASDYTRVDTLNVMTVAQDNILCRRYPDEVISETRNAMMFMEPTALDVKCWTTPSIKNYVASTSEQRIQQIRLSTTWLMTTTGCYVNENNIANHTNFAQRLAYCVPPQHWVATLQPQYGRADCYQYPTLGAPSMNLDAGNHVDLSCFQDGESVQNNPMWYKVMDHGCYMPAGVFDDKKFLGTPGGRCGL